MVNSPETFYEHVPREQGEWVWRQLWTQSKARWSRDVTVRLAVIVGVTRLLNARSGELVQQRVSDVDLAAGHLTLRVTKFQAEHTLPMDEALMNVMTLWLERRRVLVAGLEGGDHGRLLVTCHHTTCSATGEGRAGLVTKHTGLALDRQGLSLAWKRWALQCNAEQAGSHGWTPLPKRFEPLRQCWARPTK